MIFLFLAGFGSTQASENESPLHLPFAPMDRPYSLRLPSPFVLERQLTQAMESREPMGFAFPTFCPSGDSSCMPKGLYALVDSVHQAELHFGPLAGYEFRWSDENSHAFEGGILASGFRGPLSFRLDARMTTEMHEDFNHPSYDREFIEKQDEDASGSVAYTSYSRYRGELNYDAAIGRFSAGRDTPHWGPALYNNLVFHRDAIPFHQLTYRSSIGPLRILTLYGQLQGEDDRVSGKESKSRSVYAHRYEWAFGSNWLLGISEQLILYSYEEPFAFLPILPLFIFKGTAYERLNNGNIAGDLNWRFAPWGRVYGEFLIDDIQSPSSLFDDNWGNKWAVVGGLQLGSEFQVFHAKKPVTLGAITEMARIEPWVYTHYLPGTAQSLNRGYPLGNPVGPDAWVLDISLFADSRPWVVGFHSRFGEKGGSEAADVMGSPPQNSTKKKFLMGPIHSLTKLSVQGAYQFGRCHFLGDLGWENVLDTLSPRGWVGIQWE